MSSQVLYHMHKQRVHLLFMQETHFKTDHVPLLPTTCRAILRRLENFAESFLIVGGDVNFVFDSWIDYFSSRSHVPKSHLKALNSTLFDMRLLDVWRVLHPTRKNFTYYSPLHNMYSRLDLFSH